jgi:TRAP-type C4-dicarboxylate transport system substrate-binding protein
VLLGCCFVVSAVGAARADDPAQLKFGFPAPPTSFVLTQVVSPWVGNVERDAAGTVKITVFPGGNIANFRNAYDRTLNGVSDVTFGLFGELAGQFPKTDVAALPFETENCSEAGLALWRILQSGVIADEYEKVKTLGLFRFPSSGFHTSKPIKGIADLKGMKFSVSTRMIGQIIDRFGGTSLSMPPTEVYQAAQRGTIDGIVTSWTATDTFKFYEVTKYHMEAPISTSPAFIFMNRDSFAKLPDAAKKAVDAHSGEVLTKALGKATDAFDAGGKAKVRGMSGHTFSEIPAAEKPEWKSRAQFITDEWLKDTPDGARVLAAFRAEVANIRAGR